MPTTFSANAGASTRTPSAGCRLGIEAASSAVDEKASRVGYRFGVKFRSNGHTIRSIRAMLREATLDGVALEVVVLTRRS